MTTRNYVILSDIVFPCCTCCYNRYGNLTPLADSGTAYQKQMTQDRKVEDVLDSLGHRRMCCRQNINNPAFFYLRDSPDLYHAEVRKPMTPLAVPQPRAQRALDFPS
jgi:DNA-directed RNA polymerase subunit N (RpoN/RPB10)